MSTPIVVGTGAAFVSLGSMDCFSCFFAVSVFTDYPAGVSSRSIPLGDNLQQSKLLPVIKG